MGSGNIKRNKLSDAIFKRQFLLNYTFSRWVGEAWRKAFERSFPSLLLLMMFEPDFIDATSKGDFYSPIPMITRICFVSWWRPSPLFHRAVEIKQNVTECSTWKRVLEFAFGQAGKTPPLRLSRVELWKGHGSWGSITKSYPGTRNLYLAPLKQQAWGK